jgi:CHAT domain-containing protein
LAAERGVGGLVLGRPSGAIAAVGENPLLLSGLALAGANQRRAAGPEEDDGILTAEEIATLDLSSVEWAVLSACDTGLGAVQAGEGVLGLRRAFEMAGAGSVIMSLWAVDDFWSRRWMAELYQGRFRRGLRTADAVREASIAILNQLRGRRETAHPFYWAGFVAAGDWN